MLVFLGRAAGIRHDNGRDPALRRHERCGGYLMATVGTRKGLDHHGWDETARSRARRLRIGVVAPPWYEVPPSGYGGIEALCYSLVRGLLGRGHDVTLIAAGRNHTEASFEATFPEPPQGLGEVVGGFIERVHAAKAGRVLDRLELDIVHDHSVAGPLTAAGRAAPTVVTTHVPVGPEETEYYGNLGPNVSLVAISNSQRAVAPTLPWVATVHNAVPVGEYPFKANKDAFALFLSRINPDKGVHLAIEAARAAGMPLVIAGRCSEPQEHEYFEREIAPRLGPDVEWLGEADARLKEDLYPRARCLLLPIQWEEPFGLVMVEAMACGTPVVALRRGSVPEIVVDGLTGFIRDDPAELPGVLRRLDEIDPRACREHVARNFDDEVMVERYEAVYRSVLRERFPPAASEAGFLVGTA
jgi:glycosyltransferase involved in cell wall biosynthesis